MSILQDAIEINEGRSEVHGPVEDSFARIAREWNTWFLNSMGYDPELEPADVSELMAKFKLARAQSGRYNEDDYRDMAGYIAHANRLRNE